MSVASNYVTENLVLSASQNFEDELTSRKHVVLESFSDVLQENKSRRVKERGRI